jgi:hypothetical protein
MASSYAPYGAPAPVRAPAVARAPVRAPAVARAPVRAPAYAPMPDSDSDSSDTESTTSTRSSWSESQSGEEYKPIYPGLNDLGAKLIPEKKSTFQASQNTSLVMITSRDRDTRLYPQPTYFTIRLPKTYRNIKTINITQLNLLNSFFNFTTARGNTYMYIRELGRTTTDPTTGATIPNDIKVQIRTGTYTTTTLVTELSNAMNRTPLFADISGGLGSFINAFQGTGDYTLLFNQPGPVVFNTLTQQYENNVAMSQLVARYFQNVQTVGTVNFTYNECLVAYYYPVIKEMTASNLPFNQYPEALPEGFTVPADYILFAFQGLDDPYILTLIQDPANQALFDAYRAENTFVTFLANKYTCAYNSQQGRLQITATGLNDSIQTDLNLEYSTYLNEEVLAAGFPSVAVFNAQYNALTQQNGSLLEFYNFIHTQFTNVFGINFGTYTAEFFADPANEIILYNTTDKYGWSPSLLPAVSSNAISQSQSLPTQISTPLTGIIVRTTDPGAANFLTSYNLSSISFSNASETTFGYTDIPFTMLPTTYTRVNFTSRCRQTIAAMTIPRYLTDRGAGTEEVYPFGPTSTPLLFDGFATTPYSTIFIRTDISGVADFNLYNLEQVNLTSRDYFRNNNTWITYVTPQILSGIRIQEGSPSYGVNPPVTDIALLSYRPHIFFQLTTDGYSADPNAKFNVDVVVETRDGSVFPAPIVVARYRDRAAFMTDVQSDLARIYYEDPRHVFERQVFQDVSSATLTISALNDQTSYITIHITGEAVIPSAIPLRVYALLHDPYGVYTQATALDYREMPYKNLPPLSDQYTPNSAIYASPLKSIYNTNVTQIGYDISGVSDNLLDYYIQSSDATLFDPLNVEAYQTDSRNGLRYLWNYGSPGTSGPAPNINPSTTSWSLYFSPGSSNQIRDLYATGASNIYLNSSIALKAPADGNETLLVNWFRAGANSTIVEEYLNPVPGGVDSVTTRIALSTPGIFLGCANATPLASDVSTNVSFADVSGVVGLSFFMAPNDIVKMNNVQLKMAYIQPSATGTNTAFTRSNTPLTLTDSVNCFYRNQATYTSITSNLSTATTAAWDDWYLANRRNVRIGVFGTADISGADVSALSLTSSIMTMTLRKVTQVAQFTNSGGTFRTREPEWGTYYSYEPIATTDVIWDTDGSTWRSTVVAADTMPTYTAGEISYPGYFLTHTNINNYSFLPGSYGIAPSVGYAMETPYAYVSSYTSDIPNSYTIVPFYWDGGAATWRAGSMYGVSFTRQPAMASPAIAGTAAPYYGPAGPFAWTRDVSTIVLAKGAELTQKPYYWNAKISFERLDQSYNPATDLTMFGGFAGISNELQDTYMFFYANTALDADLSDIYDGTTAHWKWGIEQNTVYKAADDQSGYNYLSYLTNLTVRSTTAAYYDYSFHVRGYVPTSQMRTGLRIIGKNYTDFGTATLAEIGQEISSLSGYRPITDASGYAFLSDPAGYSTIINTNDAIRLSGGNFFSHQYADALVQFDGLFQYPGGITFGKKIGYAGRTFTLNGYQDSLNQYVGYYSTLRGTQVAYTTVLSTATGRLNQYVSDRYANVLPANILSRSRITDPLPFSILFRSKLEEPYLSMFDEWGLGWNLGFSKQDTPYLTTLVANTFIRIFDDYIYLKLNPEMNLNCMGVSAKEDTSLSLEAFSEERKYFAKILLNNFGGFCRAAVQMPKDFNPTLGKYDKISLQLVDRNGQQIDNVDCDYDIVLQITEVIDGGVNAFAVPQGY